MVRQTGSAPRSEGPLCPKSAKPERAGRESSQSLAHGREAELIEAIRAGSEAHFNELYDCYFQRIYNFVHARVRNHADTEEIVQETFTAVYRSLESYRGQSALLSWIYGIAKNTVNNHLRRSKAQELRLEKAEPELMHPAQSFAACTPEERLALYRYAEAINQRLASVSSWQAEVFLLRHVEDLPIQEISRRTQRSSDAIRSSLYRVKRLLVEAADLEWAATAS
ncbi:MAG: RNA polymerase sigma factor [Proteobacteria bacterium]|nr:RNA polymerase sigma factor [Pseudomonadota bacterium]